MAKRIPYVDGLRAVAVLAVLGCHTSAALAFGGHGVELFFVISGFCLSYPFLWELRARGVSAFDVSKYAASRLVRIVPPYWCAIAVLWLAFPLFRVDALDALKQALFLDGGTRWINQSFWSLAVELRWYLMFPVLLWLFVRSRRAYWFVALLCAASALTKASSLDAGVLPAFMLGIAAAERRVRNAPLPVWLLPAAAIAAPLALWTAWDIPWQILAFAFVSAAGSLRPLERLLAIRPLAGIGTASYSIYLVHLPVVYYVRSFDPWLAAAAGIACGGAFWLIFERPFAAGRARSVLLRELQSIPRVLRAAGVPQRFVLAGPPPAFVAPVPVDRLTQTAS